MSEHAVRKLRPLLTERRAATIERVIERRLVGISVLLEGIHDHGNVVAVMRTCEALGVHRVHWVDLIDEYKEAKKVGQGAEKWLELREHADLDSAVAFFEAQGARLVAADLEAEATLDELDVTPPIVLVFGNEHEGISEVLRARCHAAYQIPMLGFTQSLNISCAAAISLHDVVKRYRARLGRAGDMTDEQKAAVRELFYRRSVRASDLIVDG